MTRFVCGSQRLAALLLCVLLCAPALADDAFLREGTDRGVPWVSGGIGLSERETLSARFGRDFNFRLQFALPSGSYVAQIHVRIVRPNGETVLEVADAGPWLLVRLPAGAYSVQASAEGQRFESSVSVPPTGTRTVIFNRWTNL